MGKESYVEVTGPESLADLAKRVRDILDLPEGEFHEDEWRTLAVFVKRIRWRDVSDYDYEVMIYTGHLADGQGRQVFDGLAASTDWALCLLDDASVPVDERPAVSSASRDR